VDNIETKVLEFIHQYKLIDTGETIVVGVSGGVDSVVLLYVLNRLSSELKTNLIVAHFNHCLRGYESDKDECFVKELASKLNLPFKSEQGEVRLLVDKEKLSIEMAARRLRHLFLARTAKEYKAKKIALAHQSDDQIELFFLRLLRGSGSEGLSGMKPISPSPVDSELLIIRPFLKLWKRELLRYAQENYIDYQEDSTNVSGDFLRNKIRNELIPLLKTEYQHCLEKIILRELDIISVESDYILNQAKEWLEKRTIPFALLHTAIQRKSIQLQLINLGVQPYFELIERLRLKPNSAMAINPETLITIDENGSVNTFKPQSYLFDTKQLQFVLEGEKGVIDFDGIKFKWEVLPFNSKNDLLSDKKENVEYFDFDRVGRIIILRHWKEGDRFHPIGFTNEQKLQDLFINNKIPKPNRHLLLIAEAEDGGIFWIEGLRISDNYKITDSTKVILKWEWER